MKKRKKGLFVILLAEIMILGTLALTFVKQENRTNVEQDMLQNNDVIVEIIGEEVPLSDRIDESEDEDTFPAVDEKMRSVCGLILVFIIIVVSYILLKNYVRNAEDFDSAES